MAGPLTEPAPGAPAPAAATKKEDRGVKLVLLAASGLTLLFLVAAMVRENFLNPWRYHQRRYRTLLASSPNESQRRLAGAFEVHVRQIDLPQLGTTDRCVSCHVGIDNPAMADA